MAFMNFIIADYFIAPLYFPPNICYISITINNPPKRMNNSYKKIILLAGDIAVLYISLYLTLNIRDGLWDTHIIPFSTTFIVWLLIFYVFELYNLHIAINNSSSFQRTAKAIGVAGLFSALYFYLNPELSIAPKTNLAIYVFIFAFLFLLWRRFFNWTLNSYLPKEKLAFVGYNEQVKELVNALKVKPQLGYYPALIISTKPIEGQIIPVTDELDDLRNIINDQNITTIILSENLHESRELRSALFNCLYLKINIINLPNFYETVTGKVPISAVNQMWFLENLSEGRKSVFDLFKRLYDLSLALFILIITSPFWPILGLIIKLESKGPVFYRQKRSGENNKIFTIIKFRTMREEGNDRSPTKRRDDRITAFGSFLRKSRIDELPQIINIIIGSMSFVGPRPEQPDIIEALEKEIPFYKERMLVKPGLTGWDQVSGEYHSPSKEDALKKIQYDLFYIKNRSVYLDLSIILKTITTVLSRSGV
jgi:exopolysaccharide biosynthesis polyprenyl glycosylphosphotransferase